MPAALLGVELGGEDVAARDDRGERHAVLGLADDRRPGRSDRRNTSARSRSTTRRGRLRGAGAAVRMLTVFQPICGTFWPPGRRRTVPGDQAEAGDALALLARLEDDLLAEADAQERAARGDVLPSAARRGRAVRGCASRRRPSPGRGRPGRQPARRPPDRRSGSAQRRPSPAPWRRSGGSRRRSPGSRSCPGPLQRCARRQILADGPSRTGEAGPRGCPPSETESGRYRHVFSSPCVVPCETASRRASLCHALRRVARGCEAHPDGSERCPQFEQEGQARPTMPTTPT